MRLERRSKYPGMVLHNTTLLHAASFPYDGFPKTPEVVVDGSLVFAVTDKTNAATDACSYLVEAMHKDLSMRFTLARCDTFRWHLNAKWALLLRLGRDATAVADKVATWNYVPVKPLVEPK